MATVALFSGQACKRCFHSDTTIVTVAEAGEPTV
jgi:hypothetical protein